MQKATAFATTIILFLLCIAFVYAEAQVGIKTGDWVRCDLTSTPSGDMPQWVKVECLSVTGTTATLKVIIHMSDGAEQYEIMTLDVASGTGNATFQMLIPANSETGDTIHIVGYGDLALAGETTGTYAGASRTVVYASFSQSDMQFSYRWDKQTGVLLEITMTQGSTSATFKATSTNLWQPSSSSPLPNLPNLPPEFIYPIISMALAIAIVVAAMVYTKHKRS